MSFLWPQSLWLLLLVPALAAGYRRLLKAKERAAARHPGLMQSARGLARHGPPALFAVALVLLLTATARPTAMMVMPVEQGTVILALDVSGSMRADDVAPTRLGAAQAAARDFVNTLPATVRVGIVAFSDGAELAMAPGGSRDQALAVIGALRPQNGTAIGSGILASLNALFPEARFNLDETVGVAAPPPSPVDGSRAIILLTDGQNSAGPHPLDAARLAAGRGVRVYTVGVGTSWGQISDGQGWRTTVSIDQDALQEIATATAAEYFYATNAPDLRQIYAALGASVALAPIRTEVGALLCVLAALLATVSAALSLFRCGRLL